MKAAFRYQLFAHVVDTSGAADALTAALRTSPRGRPMTGSPRTFLILLLLAAADGELTIERMHQIATRELPRNIQLELGTVRPTTIPGSGEAGDRLADMPIHELYYLSRTITRKLSWTGTYAPASDDGSVERAEQERRQAALRDLTDRLIQATLPDRPGSSYALDESGIWAWAKGRKTRRANQSMGTGASDEKDAGESARPHSLSACPDAGWGTKTGKDGQQDSYFGYGLHALVRVPDLRPGPSFTDEDDPILIEAIELTPAATDVVDVSLNLLDRVRAHTAVRDLIADRHYSYKDPDRWARELWTRGIHPVLDLREDEHGFRDYDGAKVTASWPHCPATPPRLGTLPRPGLGASKAAREGFAAKIAERQAYAMRRVKSHVPDGASRWECPARAGKIGCPHVAGTVEVAHQLDLPVVTRPPAEDAKPTCCTQRTFMIRVEPPTDTASPAAATSAAARDRRKRVATAMKHAQDEYWGDHRWETSYNRRTFVEGAFGNLKNPNTENLSRGLFRFTGLPLVTLALTAAVVAANVRQLRNWHHRTRNGEPTNPLLAPEPKFSGFVLLQSDDVQTDDRADDSGHDHGSPHELPAAA